MTDTHDPSSSYREEDSTLPADQSPYEQELEVEDDAPRRAASARFIVDAEVGSDAAMRNAMDPANQSLAEALRLSFRVLQAVILVLVILFLASGFRTVGDGMSGVATVWGQIVSIDGQQALSPGPQFSFYPYPIGDFLIFQVENRDVDLGSAFAPATDQKSTQDDRLARAEISQPIMPNRDGSLLTKDGDLAHMELSAKYIIDQPVEFVRQVNDDDKTRGGDKLVQLALQRAAIQVTAGATLQDLINPNMIEDTRQKIQKSAQDVLNSLGCGIQLASVHVQRSYAPLAIEKTLGDQQAARVEAAEATEKARESYAKTLDAVAGDKHRELLALIEQYEDALDRNDQAQSANILASINAILESNDIIGDVSQIIQMARSYQSQIERTLGLEYKRFESLLAAYRQDPKLIITQLWLDAYAQVTSSPDAEIIYVPDPLMAMRLNLTGSPEIQDRRRKDELARKQQEANASSYDRYGRILRSSDVTIGKAGRQLMTDKDGNLKNAGGPRR